MEQKWSNFSLPSPPLHFPAVGAVSVTCLVGLEDNPQIVLQVMRRYIQHFFGCKACAQHFEEMAKESMDSVKSLDQAVLWLWEKHNVVNNRLAGRAEKHLRQSWAFLENEKHHSQSWFLLRFHLLHGERLFLEHKSKPSPKRAVQLLSSG